MSTAPRLSAIVGALALTALSALALAQPAHMAGAAESPEKLLWRARTRLERGDVFLSQPLYERVYEAMRDQDGPLLAEAAQGLAICEIARGHAPGAVAPWLEALRLRAGGVRFDESQSIPPLFDDQSGLAPLLAPIWLAGPELAPLVDDHFAERFLASSTSGSEVLVALAHLYRRAALFELGLPPPAAETSADALPAAGEAAPAIAIVSAIIHARVGDSAQRAAARQSLEAALAIEIESSPGSWREAWLRAGLGRSLLRESDPALRDAGMLELMHVPARFGDSQPRLAALALAEVARELESRGQQAASQAVAGLLSGSLADPDALRWLREPARVREDASTNPPPPASPQKESHES